MNGNALLTPRLCLYSKKVFQQDRVAELMMIKFSASGHPVFRSTSPLSRGTLKSKGGGKISIHFSADGDTIETVSRTIISVNQLIYGAVSDLCEEYSSCRTRTKWQSNLTHFSRKQIIGNDTYTFD